MQTLTRDEISQRMVGGINLTEGKSENGEAIVTYEVLETGETFVQVVKEDKNHESYQVEPALIEELKVELSKNTKLADLKARLEAEKLKPPVDYKQIWKAKVQAELAAAEAARVEAEKVVGVKDAVIIEEPVVEPVEEVKRRGKK